MRFFAFRITRKSPSVDVGPIAHANGWIKNASRDEAYLQAEKMINDQGWEISATLEDHVVTKDNYSPDDENLRYYEQALVDDEVLVLYVVKSIGNQEE